MPINVASGTPAATGGGIIGGSWQQVALQIGISAAEKIITNWKATRHNCIRSVCSTTEYT